MSYVLYNRSGSGGFAVEAALTLAGVEFDLQSLASLPNEPLHGQIGHVNSWGQVPVLQLPDGTVMTELSAIMAYLTTHEPGFREGPHLYCDNVPEFLRWSVFLCVNVYEGILRRSYPQRFCVLSGQEGDGPGSDAWLIKNISDAARHRTHKALLCLQSSTHGAYLLGDRMSACDLILAMLYAWHNRKPDLPRLTAITERVATHEIVRPIWKANFETRLDFKWHEL